MEVSLYDDSAASHPALTTHVSQPKCDPPPPPPTLLARSGPLPLLPVPKTAMELLLQRCHSDNVKKIQHESQMVFDTL